jgi:transcriptional regulator with XRE-family HTH domain
MVVVCQTIPAIVGAMPKRISFTEKIRRAVDASGLTRRQISDATGLDEPMLSRFVAGKVGLSMNSLDKLADVLKLDVVSRANGKNKSE